MPSTVRCFSIMNFVINLKRINFIFLHFLYSSCSHSITFGESNAILRSWSVISDLLIPHDVDNLESFVSYSLLMEIVNRTQRFLPKFSLLCSIRIIFKIDSLKKSSLLIYKSFYRSSNKVCLSHFNQNPFSLKSPSPLQAFLIPFFRFYKE